MFVGLLLFACVFLAGYAIGAGKVSVPQVVSNDPLVEIAYSGGWIDDPGSAVGFVRLYPDGTLSTITRAGDVKSTTTVDRANVLLLQQQLDDLDPQSAFTKKDRRMCSSFTDGVDTEMRLRTSDGQESSYSDCDYTFNVDDPFIHSVYRIVLGFTFETAD